MMESMQPQHYEPRPPQDPKPDPIRHRDSNLDRLSIAAGVIGGILFALAVWANSAHDSSSTGALTGIGLAFVAVAVVLAILARRQERS